MAKEKLPTSFSSLILERVLDEEDLQWLVERYEEGKLRNGWNTYKPTPQDLTLYKKWFKGELGTSEVAEKMGVGNNSTVLNRFAIIGRQILSGDIELSLK